MSWAAWSVPTRGAGPELENRGGPRARLRLEGGLPPDVEADRYESAIPGGGPGCQQLEDVVDALEVRIPECAAMRLPPSRADDVASLRSARDRAIKRSPGWWISAVVREPGTSARCAPPGEGLEAMR